MKRIISVLLCAIMLLPVFSIIAGAKEAGPEVTHRTVERLEDGSYFVIEVTQSNPLARSATNGYKTATYYNASNTAIWAVRVHGYFSYTRGVSSKATSSSAEVLLYHSQASFLSKDAYVSGSTAYGSARVKYGIDPTSKSVSLTCDSYGNLS